MKTITIVSAILLITGLAFGQNLTLPSTSTATTDNALSVLSNPAWLGYRPHYGEFTLLFPYNDSTSSQDLGLLVQLGHLGFAGEFVNNDLAFYNRYTLGEGFSLGQGIYMGFNYNWYRVVDWQGSWNIGMGFRPLPFLSAGAVVYDLNQPDHGDNALNPSYSFSAAVRPIGHRLTLSGDLLLTKDAARKYGDSLDPVLRLEAIPLDGIKLTGEYRTKSQFFSVGLGLAIDNMALGSFRNMDKDGKHQNSVSYLQFTSDRQKNIFSPRHHQIVEITLDGKMHEAKPSAFPFFWMKPERTLQRLCEEIRHYSEDPRVDGLLLKFDNPELGIAQMQQLRRALEDFKTKGKKLFAYSEAYSQLSYYLATACDEIYVMPVGDVDLHGLAAIIPYWKGTLDKLGIQVQVVKVRDYKTAANSLIYEDSPPQEAEMWNWLLDDLYTQICKKIGEGRHWTMDEVQAKIDEGMYYSPTAYQQGLVDSLIYYDGVKDILKKKNLVLVSEVSYWMSPEYKEDWPDLRTPRVAIIYAEGEIASGKNRNRFLRGSVMGSKSIANAIRAAREDGTIDGIILRVDSPGGSAIASDAIYREVQRTVTDEKNRKPIFISMGNLAASGGYYIACGADTIIAEEGTITGSIGVIGLKPSFAGLYEKIGWRNHIYKRGARADLGTLARPLTDMELTWLQTLVELTYQDFISRVAQGREMTTDQVNAIGEGRVWTGKQAKEKGLVDLIGGMDVALAAMRARLGVEEKAEVELEFYPKPAGMFQAIGDGIFKVKGTALPPAIIEALEPLSAALEYRDGEPLMLMLYDIDVK